MTKSRTPLFLTELVIMLLVFAAVSALCMRLFTEARQTSRDSRDITNAAVWASSAADACKAAGGNVEKAAALLDADFEDGYLTLDFDGQWNRPGSGETQYRLLVGGEASRGGSVVTVLRLWDGEELFRLEVKGLE